jgi:hypothetical protein
MKICITTASFGAGVEGSGMNSLELPELPKQSTKHELELVQLNDSNFSSRELAMHPRLKGKIPKMLQWMQSDADYYIWLDSKFRIISPNFVEWQLRSIGNKQICLFEHPNRCSIKEELDFMQDRMKAGDAYLLERYRGEPMAEQVDTYLSDPAFKDDCLFSCGMLIYHKSLIENRAYNLLTDWFFHCTYWSVQDQLSLPYLIQKHKIVYELYDDMILRNPFTIYG